MKGSSIDTIVEIRSILADMHDRRVGKRSVGLDLTELAALRDCCRRLTEAVSSEPQDPTPGVEFDKEEPGP